MSVLYLQANLRCSPKRLAGLKCCGELDHEDSADEAPQSKFSHWHTERCNAGMVHPLVTNMSLGIWKWTMKRTTNLGRRRLGCAVFAQVNGEGRSWIRVVEKMWFLSLGSRQQPLSGTESQGREEQHIWCGRSESQERCVS